MRCRLLVSPGANRLFHVRKTHFQEQIIVSRTAQRKEITGRKTARNNQWISHSSEQGVLCPSSTRLGDHGSRGWRYYLTLCDIIP